MPESTFEEFIAPESEWIHEAIAVLEELFGVSDVDIGTDDDGKLVVDGALDPQAA